MLISTTNMGNSKSQTFFSDFAISIFILITIFIIYVSYTTNLSNRSTGSLEDLLTDAKTISSSLISKGHPDNWNSTNVVRIGFTDDGNRIDNGKFIEFAKINYSKSKRLLGTTNDYFIFFENESGGVKNIEGFCGVGKLEVNITYNIKSAYYYRGPGEEQYLKSFMETKFNADVYQEGGTGNDLDALIDNIKKKKKYDFVVMESPELSTSNFDKFKDAAESFVEDGGLLMIGGQLLAAQGRKLTGVEFYKIAGISESDRVATVVRQDPFTTFKVPDQIQFTQAYYVININANDFADIARFNESDIEFKDILDNKVAVAKWSFDNGKVLFFSDFDAKYFKGNFQENLEASVRKWIGATCLAINLNNINKTRLVRTDGLLIYNSEIVKMVLYVWS